MTDQPDLPPDDDAAGAALTDADLGEPLAELENLAWQPGEDFGRKVSGRIERRLLTGRFLDMAWSAPLLVLLELLRAPLELFSGGRRAK